jgi:hypothetical protein
MGGVVAAPLVSTISTIGTAVSAVSAIGGLIGGQDQPDLPSAPQLSPAQTGQAEGVLEDESAKLRALKRRQASTQKLFKLDSDDDQGTLLGE